jgi:hypothetical protein
MEGSFRKAEDSARRSRKPLNVLQSCFLAKKESGPWSEQLCFWGHKSSASRTIIERSPVKAKISLVDKSVSYQHRMAGMSIALPAEKLTIYV